MFFLGSNPAQKEIELFSNENLVTKTTPPAFIVLTQNDAVENPVNGMLFYQAMTDKNVSGSLHIFPEDGHSIAWNNNPKSINLWTTLCEEWFNDLDILDKTKSKIIPPKTDLLKTNRF